MGRLALVVEDNFLAALEVQEILRQLGFEVVGPVATSSDALSAIDQAPRIDVAILDVHLRGGTCAEVVTRLRAQGTPFLLLTGYAQPDLGDVLDGMPPPLQLGKPLVESRFRAAVEALCPSGG